MINTKFEAVHPAKVLNNLFFNPMNKAIEKLAFLIGIDVGLFRAMMSGELPFDTKSDEKICEYLNMPVGTIIKGQHYYLQFNKQGIQNDR